MTGNILSAELLPGLFNLSYLHQGALRQRHTHEAMQPEQNASKQNQEWLLQKCHHFLSASCTSVFTLQEAQLPFPCPSFPTAFMRAVCLLWPAVSCEVSEVGPYLCVHWFSRADPGRGLWALHSTGEPYFYLAYLKWQQQPEALTLESSPPSPQNHCSAILLVFRCWSKLDPCVSHLVLFLNR